MMTNFLTSKLNLIMLMCLGYITIGYMMYFIDITFSKQVMMFAVISLIHFIAHLMGVSRGITFATIHAKELSAFLRQLDKMEKTGEPFDLEELNKDK